MKQLICCLIVLIWFENSLAQEQAEEQAAAPEIQVQKETHQGSKATTWPHPFTPSEEVSGDAQVAFPTDI